MLYTIIKKSGRIIDFDTEKFCANEPFKSEAKGSIHVNSEFNLCLDLLDTYGLVLELFWYDARVSDPKEADKTYDPEVEEEVFHAQRRIGRYICLVDKEEVDDVVQIFRDNKLVAWRVGDCLVDGVKFAAQELLCFSDTTTTSINAKAVKLFEYLKNANPELSDEVVAKIIGYSKGALDQIRDYELANINVETYTEEEDSNSESDDFDFSEE